MTNIGALKYDRVINLLSNMKLFKLNKIISVFIMYICLSKHYFLVCSSMFFFSTKEP